MQILNIFHVLLAIAMVALILVQRGAGATAGAAFGGGASGTVFGSSGAGNFLTRTTSVAAIGFFVISMWMAVMASNMNAAAPEADLGVLANDSVMVETIVPEVPVTNQVEAAESADLPAVETATESVSGDDLPPVDNPGKP